MLCYYIGDLFLESGLKTGEGTAKINEKGVGISKNDIDRTKIWVTSLKTEVSRKEMKLLFRKKP